MNVGVLDLTLITNLVAEELKNKKERLKEEEINMSKKNMQVKCDKCGNTIVVKSFKKYSTKIPTKDIQTLHVNINYIQCLKCKAKFFVCFENKHTLYLKEQIVKNERNPKKIKFYQTKLKELTNEYRSKIDLSFYKFVNVGGK